MGMPGGKPTTADVLSMRQARAMISYLRDHDNLRDAALVGIAAGYGLRLGDAVGLTWRAVLDDVGGIRGSVQVTEEKTGNQRVLLTMPFVATILAEWKEACGKIDLDAPVVPVSKVTGWRIVKRAAAGMGMKGNVSPHSLRKAFCDFAYHQTNDPVLTCDITGHKNPAQLLAYIGRDREAVADVWARMTAASKKM